MANFLKINDSKRAENRNEFIPAAESALTLALFSRYVKWFIRLRFRRVWIRQSYFPGAQSRTIYYLNHSSWWDGLIPVLLDRSLFRQQARAMMEDKQMKRYPFFRRLGAFSVPSAGNPGSWRSLRYALRSMDRENASLYIYPEGKMVPFSTQMPAFREGLAWLHRQLPEVDVVPVGIYIQNMRYSRPEMHIQVGVPVRKEAAQAATPQQHEIYEEALRKVLIDLQQSGGIKDDVFERWL